MTGRRTKKAPEAETSGTLDETQNNGSIQKSKIQAKFDLSDLTVADDDLAGDFDEIRMAIPVRKPGKTEWFRAHPGPEYTANVRILEIDAKDGGMTRERYILHPNACAQLAIEQYPISLQKIHLCVNSNGAPFLWPIKQPLPGSSWNSYNLTAQRIAAKAQRDWVRMFAVKAEAGYRAVVNENFKQDPQFPEEGLNDLLNIAFADFYIENVDHPVIQELAGKPCQV